MSTDGERKLHPCLVPYDQLPEQEKLKDIDAIASIPRLLARMGYEVRLPDVDGAERPR